MEACYSTLDLLEEMEGLTDPARRATANRWLDKWSFQVMAHPDLKGRGPVAVAWVIRLHLNAKKLDAWPGLDTLAERTGLKRRAVINAIDALESAGLLLISRGGGMWACGRGRPNTYWPAMPDSNVHPSAPLDECATVHSEAATVHSEAATVHSDTSKVHSSAPEPLTLNPDRTPDRLTHSATTVPGAHAPKKLQTGSVFSPSHDNPDGRDQLERHRAEKKRLTAYEARCEAIAAEKAAERRELQKLLASSAHPQR